MRLKIGWASLLVRSKFTVFPLFYFVFEGNFPSTSPREAHIWRGDVTEVFCVTGLRGLYMEGHTFGILRYFRVPSTYASSPPSESLEQATIKSHKAI